MLLWRKRKAFRREGDPWCRAVLFWKINVMPVTKLLMMLSAKYCVSFWLIVRKKLKKRYFAESACYLNSLWIIV